MQDKLSAIFDLMDEICVEFELRSANIDVMEDISEEDVREYWSTYNLEKRLIRALMQTNRRIAEFCDPEVFKRQQEKQRALMSNLENKPNGKQCLKCGVLLAAGELQLCGGCEKTYE
jgi:hypothetical protein